MSSVTTSVFGVISPSHASLAAISPSYTAGIWNSIISSPTSWVVNGPGLSNVRIVSAAPGDPANDLGLGSESDQHLVITVNSSVFDGEGGSYIISYSPVSVPTGAVICFGAGTRILTINGYKAVETLTKDDKLKTSDGRVVSAKGITFEVPITTKSSAPYRVEAGAFGRNKPAAPITLSPTHKVQIGPHLWTSPVDAATSGNKRVKQYGIGEPMQYYHIECENYLRDNLVAEGLVVESLAPLGAFKGVQVYTWSARMNGYTRISSTSGTMKKI